MKVLHLIAGRAKGGAEKFCARLLPALQKRDVEQYAISRTGTLDAEALREAGVKVKEASFSTPLFDLSTHLTIRKISKEFQPDIIFTWMNRASLFAGSAKSGKTPVMGRLGGYYKIKNYKHCDYLAGNTPDIVEYLGKEGFPKENLFYLPNFAEIDLSSKLDRNSFGTDEKSTIVLSLGRLHPNKGFDVLLPAIAKLENTVLWLCGEGELKEALEKQAKELHIENRVKFLGWRNDASRLYRTADIFVCPSRHEPLGNVVLEAMAHEIPVIAANVSGPSHLIDHGKSGLLFESENSEDLTKQLSEMISSPDNAQEMVKIAAKEYNSKYGEEKICSEYIKTFEEILAKHPRSA